MLGKLFGKLKRHYEPKVVSIEPLGVTFEVASDQTLLQAALAAGLNFPHHCTVGTCGNCKCKLRQGEVRSLMDATVVLTTEEYREGYILACQCLLKSDAVVEVDIDAEDIGQPGPASFSGAVVAIEDLTHDIKAVSVQLDKPLSFRAGQFADITLPKLGSSRSYSFANGPVEGGSDKHEFIVRRVPGGQYTQWLFEGDRVGGRFELDGPKGAFWLRPGDSPVLFIAGGSGMAPVLSILRDMLARQIARPVAFLFGAREQRDLYYQEELDTMAKRWPEVFTFLPILSAEPSGSDWSGKRGMVTEYIDEQHTGFPILNSHAYLCGPPAMIDAALLTLNQNGLGTGQIYYDKFLDSGQLTAGRVEG